MSDERGVWGSGELLAYTEGDGPGRPPAAAPTWLIATLVGVVGVTFVGVLASDTLCPDHRAWVQTLGTIGFLTIIGAIVGLVRGWAIAPLLTMIASALGVLIGLIDAVHSPTRGRLVALGFSVALVLAGFACARVIRLRGWDRDAVADLDAPAPPLVDDAVAMPEATDTPAGIHADR